MPEASFASGDNRIIEQPAETPTPDSICDYIPAYIIVDEKLRVLHANDSFRRNYGKLSLLPVHHSSMQDAATQTLNGQAQIIRTFHLSTPAGPRLCKGLFFKMNMQGSSAVAIFVSDNVAEAYDHHARISHIVKTLAHDLNNSNVTVVGFAGLLLKEQHSESTKNDLSYILKAGEQSGRLYDKLFRYASEACEDEGEVKVRTLLETAIRCIKQQMDVKAITFNLQLQENLRCVKGEVGQLTWAIEALLMNSCQAMPSGGAVTIQVQNVALENQVGESIIEVRIIDEGHGITEENLDLAFKPFSTTRKKQWGIGLSLAKYICAKHNGWLNIEKSSPAGTTMFLVLPATTCKEAEECSCSTCTKAL